LLDHPKLLNQLSNLERRTARSGRDNIDHQPGGHDDVANAVAGLAAINNLSGFDPTYRGWNEGDAEDEAAANARWRMARYAAYVASGGILIP